MSIVLTRTADGETIAPEGKLDLSTVGELHAALIRASGSRLTLDLGRVTHFGALALQVVYAAALATQARGARFAILNASDRLVAQMSAMGMTPETITEPLP